MERIRQPIVTVCGHVDHGKTSILDRVRGSNIAEKEAGGITQKISFTLLPKETIEERAGEILKKFNIPLEIPGFLFIDTPGHAAFTNLRKRGGNLADLAVLVIDINEGIKPQTIETLQILKANKTPFVIALNKLDNISGWKPSKYFLNNLEKQAVRIKENFEEKMYVLIDSLSSHKINAELYTKISDFTKNIALIPCSAKTGEGISEILGILCALSQRFLKEQISINKSGKGVILEIKKEKSMNYAEAILYDGELKIGDEIAIASFSGVIKEKIKNLHEAMPLSKGYKASEKVTASAGIRILIKDDILPGMPFQVIENNLKEIEKEFEKEISEVINVDSRGIIVKAESLGSLEALILLLKQKQIPIIKADIGKITKKDVYQALANPEEERIILGFNVTKEEDIESKDVKIILNDVVYKLIEDLEKYRQELQKKIEREKLEELPSICKITILPYLFRNSNPAIFGVRVDSGKLKHNLELINRNDEKIARVKTIQEEKNNIPQAEKGKEVAISLPGVNFERELKQGDTLYSNLSETQFRKFKDNKSVLSQDEIRTLQEIAEIKRRKNVTWGI